MAILEGKVAIVTGAGGGIGRAHALALATEGAQVVVNDVGGARDGAGSNAAMAEEVVAQIRESGGQAVANQESVADVASAERIVESALDHFGRLDVLVNNAGILRDKTLLKTEEAMWDAVIQVHLKGTYCVTRPAVAHMKAQGSGGAVINTSSTSGLEGNFGQCNYGAAKAGIAGFTRCLALEVKRYGIRVNAIAPVAHTRMTEDLPFMGKESSKQRFDPKLISPLVVYLASDLAADVTKRIFFVGGGTISQMKMLRGEGVTKTEDAGLWRVDEIAAAMERILDE